MFDFFFGSKKIRLLLEIGWFGRDLFVDEKDMKMIRQSEGTA